MARRTSAPSREPETNSGRLDETIEGGRYATPDGRLVNANGEPLEDAAPAPEDGDSGDSGSGDSGSGDSA